MNWFSFNLIDYRPLWKTQNEDDEYLVLTLPLSLLALIFVNFLFSIYLVAQINIGLIERTNNQANLLNILLNNFIFEVVLSLIVSIVTISLLYQYHPTFYGLSITSDFQRILEISLETLVLEKDEKKSDHQLLRQVQTLLIFDLLKVYILSLLGGFLLTLVYFIPYFVLYVLLLVILINFISIPTSLTLAMIISWIIVAYWIIKKRVQVEEKAVNRIDPHAEYGISERKADIIASNQPPIICSGCKSYIAATSKFCKVCGDPVLDED